MSSDEESRKHLIQHKLDKADSTIDDIRSLLDNDKLDIVCSK